MTENTLIKSDKITDDTLIKSGKMTEMVNSAIRGTAGWVIFFGVFTAVCLIIQCLDQILNLWLNSTPLFFNKNFIIPMDTLTTLYATLCASYIGVDRMSFAISTFKGTKNNADYGHPERNRHIIIQNFFICSLALILNRFFDVPLGLEALIISFGASVILYVSGQRVIFQASKLAPTEKDKNANGIDDRIEENKELIKVLNTIIRDKKSFKIYIKDLSGRDSLVYASNPEDIEQYDGFRTRNYNDFSN